MVGMPNLSIGQDIAELAVNARDNLYEHWDFKKAASYFDKVIGKKHAPAFAYSDYGWYLMLLDRHDEGMEYIKRAANMAPKDKQLVTWYAWAIIWDGDLPKARQWIQKALKLDPSYGEALHVSSRIESVMGNHNEAIKLALQAASSDPTWRGIVPIVYAHAGQKRLAKESAAQIEKNVNGFDAMFLMEYYDIIGSEEMTMDYLEKTFELRHPFMPWIEIIDGSGLN